MTSIAITEPKIQWWREKSVWVLLLLGFSAGMPYFLIFGTLSLWLLEAGVERSAVTYFSWAVLGYSFKFVWAPLVDRLPLPLLTKLLGRRRGWLLLAQVAVISSIVLMSSIDPARSLSWMAASAVLLGFAAATQDIVIDAYRIEAAEPRLQAMLSSTYVAGYRTGMIVAGAVALALAQELGSSQGSYSYAAWQQTYLIMAGVMGVGILTTLLIKEPNTESSVGTQYPTRDYISFFGVFLLSIVALILVYSFFPTMPILFSELAQKVFVFFYDTLRMVVSIFAAYTTARVCVKFRLINPNLVRQGYLDPIVEFLKRYGKLAIWVLLLVGLYRISDIVMGVITNVFYAEMGYTKKEIASITKVFGVLVTIFGAFMGGLLAIRIGVMRSLMLGAVLVAVTNLLFMWLAQIGGAHTYLDFSIPLFFTTIEVALPKELLIVIIMDNLAQGFAIAAFIGWLSALTNVSFTATQYAIFSSLMTLVPKLIGGYSGTLVDGLGYENFFLFASALGVPVIGLIYFLQKRLEFSKKA
ncbi:MAG: PAT family beta-lactamase induction signal transducer AmpG [Arenicella sp.]|jgi:PAT family beta-lactamase induction signal transducer AmpG